MDEEQHIDEWVISVTCVAFWLFCVVVNPVLFARREIMKRPGTPSLIPVVGGIFGGVGLSHMPIAQVNPWFWTSVLLDFGSVPWVLYVLGKVAIERIRMKQ